ncbi:MAG TPA: NF038122 family metalloprotease [Stellaceae bacterium]|nr:NF038122 family metalloprotease [Stellaceae bacterium]
MGSAPASFDTEVIAAFQFFANTFNNPGVVLYYDVGYGEVGGSTIGGGALGESSTSFGATYGYSTLRSKLSAHAATGDAAARTVLANDLPSTNPVFGMFLNTPTAQDKALGLISGSSGSFSNVDGQIGFSKSLTSGGVPQPGFLGVVEHEISEVMGRSSALDGAGDYSVMDLFRYAAPGVRQLSDTGNPSYFSLDGGRTDIFNWNNPSNVFGDNGDLGDWLSTNTYTPDAFNDDGDPSVSNPVTSRDIALMDVLGWDRASSTTYTIGTGHTSTGIVIYSGDNEFVKSGGTAVATFAMSGGLETVSAGGADRTAKLLSGAEQDVFGAARFVVVNGGTQVVGAGGVASGGTLSNGGGQFVDSRGVASGATIRGGGSGGFQAVYGGTATGTVVSNGGAQFVAFGGTAIGSTVRSGGFLEVFSAGRASGTTISRSGSEIVSSGSIANVTTINGGLFEVASGGVAGGTVTFVSGGTLQLDAGAGFTGTIKGFASPDRIDLRRISFAAGPTQSFTEAPSSTSGTLTVTDGTHTVQLTLLGFHATNDFALSSDNHGGTQVTDPPAAFAASSLTFADIAPARLHSGAPNPSSARSYLPSALAANDRAYAGRTLLATGPPGAPGEGDRHHPLLPALR